MRPRGDPADARQAGFSNGILILEGHLMIEITHYHMVRLCKLEGRQNIPDGTGFATGNADKPILKQAVARGHADVKRLPRKHQINFAVRQQTWRSLGQGQDIQAAGLGRPLAECREASFEAGSHRIIRGDNCDFPLDIGLNFTRPQVSANAWA